MTAFRSMRSLLLWSLLLFTVSNSQASKVVRLAYHFAFEDEGIITLDRIPTSEEVEAVLCQTNVFFTKSFQKEFNNPALAVIATDADWAFEDYQMKTTGSDGSDIYIEMPVGINFTLTMTTRDDRPLPTLNEVQLKLPALDLESYLRDYVMKAAPNTANYFYEARGIHWQSAVVENVEGANITMPECPKGAQPEALTVGGLDVGEVRHKENFTGFDYAAYNAFSLKLGFWDDAGREPREHEWEALICEVDRFIYQEIQKGLKDNNISSHSMDIEWGFDEGAFLPAQLNFSVAASFANGTDVQSTDIFEVLTLSNGAAANFTSKFINKAFPDGFNVFANVDKLVFRGMTRDEVVPANVLAQATCPVTVHSGKQASFVIKFELDTGALREPTKDEIEAVICETNKFFQKYLREKLEDPSIVSYATNVDWSYDVDEEYQASISFQSTTMNGDGSYVKGSKVLEIMETADIEFYTEFYVLNAQPYESNVFFQTKNLNFVGTLGKDVSSTKLPKGAQCKNHDDHRLASFSIAIGFANRTDVPIKQDVEGLICQTNLFFENRLQTVLKDQKIHAHATNIDWSYNPSADLAAVVNFTAFVTYGDGNLVSAKNVYDAMKVIDVPDYVQTYVWNSEPLGENIYYDTMDILFAGSISAPVRKGKLARATCTAPVLSTANITAVMGKRSGEQTTMKNGEIQEDSHYSKMGSHLRN